MKTIILHFILASITAIASVVAYLGWRATKYSEDVKRGFFLFFFFFIGYHLSLVFPFLIFGANLRAIAWGYIVAIIFIFLLLVPIWRIVLNRLFGLSIKKINFIITLLLLAGLLVTIIEIYDFRLPIFDESGFIFWNANIIAALITSFSAAILETVSIFYLIKNWPSNLSTFKKIKTALFMFGLMMFIIACIYFLAFNLTMVITAFVTVSLGTLSFLITLLIRDQTELTQ
ncbi:MAG: hypothetical protein AB1643_00635 [Patescibacteria group bacterium]